MFLPLHLQHLAQLSIIADKNDCLLTQNSFTAVITRTHLHTLSETGDKNNHLKHLRLNRRANHLHIEGIQTSRLFHERHFWVYYLAHVQLNLSVTAAILLKKH